MTKLSSVDDQLIRCCMFGSSNILPNFLVTHVQHIYRTTTFHYPLSGVDILIELVDESCLDYLWLMNGGCSCGGCGHSPRIRRTGGDVIFR